jgi:thymidylate kinase/glycosyltransferase involved in cell wall biosynthesis
LWRDIGRGQAHETGACSPVRSVPRRSREAYPLVGLKRKTPCAAFDRSNRLPCLAVSPPRPPRRWKITLVTELAGPPDEGMRVWTRHYATALRAAGHSVQVLRAEGNPRFAAADPRTLARVAAARPEVIQYVPYSGLTPAALVRLRALGLAAPRALRAISVLQSGRPGLTARPRLAADVALFASHRLRRATGAVARRSAVAYPIVDTTRFCSATVDRAALRRELGVPEGPPLALHVGHLKPSRGLDILGDLAASGELAVLMVASTSTAADPELRSRLEHRGVRVVRRFLPDIERVYRAADVYVFPVEDPLGSIEVPLSVVEALASDVPVVATRFGALPELFPPGSRVTYSEPAGFAAAVTGALHANGRGEPADLGALSEERFVAAVEATLPRGAARLVVLSGVDGAGKTTQIQRLAHRLERRDLTVATVWCRWDPLLAKPAVALLGRLTRWRRRRGNATDGASAADARRSVRARLLRRRPVWLAWRALMVLDYGVRLAPLVRSARRANDVVLLDRYWHDVLVDFSFGGPLHEPPALLRRLLPAVDGIVILDVPEAIALQRKTDTPDAHYLSERRRLYGVVAERYGATVIDATPAPEVVAEAVDAAVDRIVGEPA